MIQRLSDFLMRSGGNLSTSEIILLIALITFLTYVVIILSGRR